MIYLSTLAPTVSDYFVGLPVLFPGGFYFPHTSRVSEKGFVLKEEFHVTLIGRGHQFAEKLSIKCSISLEDAQIRAAHMFIEALRGQKFRASIKKLEYFEVSKVYQKPRAHSRRTIVIPCFLESADTFYRNLAGISGISLEPTPHHITVYVGDDVFSHEGTGIVTRSEFMGHSRKIENSNWLKSMPRM